MPAWATMCVNLAASKKVLDLSVGTGVANVGEQLEELGCHFGAHTLDRRNLHWPSFERERGNNFIQEMLGGTAQHLLH